MTAAPSAIIPRDWKVTGASLFMLAAGIIHFLIIPHHWEHAPGHGIAMITIGVLEVFWAVLYWQRPTKRLSQFGAVLAICVVTLWALTRIFPAPFTNRAEEIDLSGVATKILEALSAAALLAAAAHAAHRESASQPVWHTVISTLLIALMLTVGLYEVTRAAAPFLPQYASPNAEPMEGAH